MRYNEDELQLIYNDLKKNKDIFKELEGIKEPLRIITKKIEFDSIDYMELIEILDYFQVNNLLNKITEESIDFLVKICFGNKDSIVNVDNTGYFNKYLKNLLLPSNLNRCDSEESLSSFFGEFDIFFDLIRDYCNIEDCDTFKKHNKDLGEIVERFFKCINYYQNSKLYEVNSFDERVIILTVLDHLGVIIYLSINEYDYKYDLYNEVFEHVLNNYLDFLYQCSIKVLFVDSNMQLEEYKLLKDVIDYKFNPPLNKKYFKENN